jgi:hypothetical protein
MNIKPPKRDDVVFLPSSYCAALISFDHAVRVFSHVYKLQNNLHLHSHKYRHGR